MIATFPHTPTLWPHSSVVNLSLIDRHQRCFQSFTITKCNVYEFSIFYYYKKISWIWIFKNEYHSAHKISHIWDYIRMMNSWRWNCWVKRICAFKIFWDILKLPYMEVIATPLEKCERVYFSTSFQQDVLVRPSNLCHYNTQNVASIKHHHLFSLIMNKIKCLFLPLRAIFTFACELSLDFLCPIFLLDAHGFFNRLFFRTVIGSQ